MIVKGLHTAESDNSSKSFLSFVFKESCQGDHASLRQSSDEHFAWIVAEEFGFFVHQFEHFIRYLVDIFLIYLLPDILICDFQRDNSLHLIFRVI